MHASDPETHIKALIPRRNGKRFKLAKICTRSCHEKKFLHFWIGPLVL
jgi:hypothetical protein